MFDGERLVERSVKEVEDQGTYPELYTQEIGDLHKSTSPIMSISNDFDSQAQRIVMCRHGSHLVKI